MSLKAVYERFLADPGSASLASDVSLIYITTTTTVNGASAVLKHLSSQQNIVKKKSERIIGAVEGPDSLCLDIETTLQFANGGGAYLLSLDDNFLDDRVATFPMVHIVRFNAQNEIQQIRLYWDQGSLLKEVEVIGSRSRSWPIRDAKDQIRLITSAVSAKTTGTVTPPTTARNDQRSKHEQARAHSPNKRHIRDPHAAESFFDLVSPGRDRTQPVIAPRATAAGKPPPRDLSDLFIEEDADATPTKSSPKKETGSVIAPKAGAGKNFKASRLFGYDESDPAEQNEPRYKPHPNKYNHFQLGDDNSEREIKTIPSRPKSQHISHWDFEDFVTPEKPKTKARGQEIRHFAWSDDESELHESPPAREPVIKPRRDAETHFQLQDDGVPGSEVRPRRTVGGAHNKGLGLYENNLYDENDNPPEEPEHKAPLAIVPNGTHRKKDFDTHWAMTDDSPPEDEKASHENHNFIASVRMTAVKAMDTHWEAYDESPEQNKAPKRVGRNPNQRSWGFGDDGDF